MIRQSPQRWLRLRSLDRMLVVAGDFSLSIYEGTEQEILPQLLVPHPEYNDSTNNHDIMLIKVGAPPLPHRAT